MRQMLKAARDLRFGEVLLMTNLNVLKNNLLWSVFSVPLLRLSWIVDISPD